jgi:D-xylose transport system substrate-binding protein
LLILCVCFSCKNSSKSRIAFLVPNLKAERYVKEKKYFEDKLKESGFETEFANSDYDQNLQFKQVSEFLDKGIKILVVGAVNVNLAAKIVREAHTHQAIVVAYDRLIRNADLDYYVSFQYQTLGQEQARYIVNLKPEGKFVVVGGDKTDYNAIQVNIGQMKVLEPLVKENKIQILYNIFIEDWNPENASHEIDFYLNLSDQVPDAIICSSDKMATGIVKTLEQHNLAGKILLTGMDAEKTSCRNILSGKQTMTVYKPFKKLAYQAAEIAIQLMKGIKITNITDSVNNGKIMVPSILIQPVPVDKNNIKSTVIADGLHAESDIYGNK